jgi:hypothetical protein
VELVKFRIWYSGGRTYRGSTERQWTRLPKRGVLVLVRYQEEEYKPGFPYRNVMAAGDWYWWPFERVKTAEVIGEWAEKPEGIAPEILKQGEMVSEAEFNAALAAAHAAKVW